MQQTKMEKKLIINLIGWFLILDGLLSIYFGSTCLNSCANNNTFGNFIRLVMAGIGLYLLIGLKK